MPLNLTITTPEGLVHQGEARAVVVPAHDGELGILPGHAPLIGILGVGELRARPASGDGEARFYIEGGFLQVLKDRVLVLATRAEPAKGIDRARAEAELKRLENDAPPPRSTIETLDQRRDRIRAARARLKVASRGAG